MLDRSMKILLTFLILLGLFLGVYEGIWERGARKVATQTPVPPPADDIYLEVIWDASGSMWGREYGIEKIIRSKEVLKALADELPEQVNLGLRIFGARRVGDMQDSFLALPFEESNREEMLNFIANVKPLGKSPIGYSLKEAGNDLQGVQGKKFILLVSDGIDNGELPPDKVTDELKEQGVVLHILYVGDLEDQDLKASLMKLAGKTGGCYFSYQDKNQVVPTMSQWF